jgi:hypothetical protein
MNRQTSTSNNVIDHLFYAPSNFEMLASLIKDTLKSRHNISTQGKVNECVKQEILTIMKHVYEHRNSIQQKQPQSLSEYNLMMNKQVLDIAVARLPQLIQQNLPCRPDGTTRASQSIDSAFKRLQDERNTALDKPQNPFIQEKQSVAQLTDHAVQVNSVNKGNAESYLTSQTTGLNNNGKESINVSSYNDTAEVLSFLDNSSTVTHQLSLADTIKQFNEENVEMEVKGDSFVESLEAKMKQREEDFQKSTSLTPMQESVLQQQIENDAAAPIENSYPMDSTSTGSLPMSMDSRTELMSSVPDKNVKTEKRSVEWKRKYTTIQLNSADRKPGQSRYDYTIDTSLFNTEIKHIECLEVKSLVMPSFEQSSVDANSVDQYVLVDIPELNTHNVGSNSALSNSQCMMFVERTHSESSNNRGCMTLKNENDTKTLYAKNVMRQFPRQLTVRVLDVNGAVFGNELTKDDVTITEIRPVSSVSQIAIRFDKPFAVGSQFRLGDVVRFTDIKMKIGNNEEQNATEFINRKRGHKIVDFGVVKSWTTTPGTTEWSKEIRISARLDYSDAVRPAWDDATEQDTNTPLENSPNSFIQFSTNFDLETWMDQPGAEVSGSMMNISAQNTLSLVVTSLMPSASVFQQE